MKKATRQHTKHHNSQLILKTIYEQENMSRAEIARATCLTKATVSTIVANLIENGLVVEVGFGPSVGGKPPRILCFADNAQQLISLDLGTECFQGALVNLRGHIQRQITLPLNERRGDQAFPLIYECVDQLIESSSSDILGLGIGTPGMVDTQQGIIKSAINLGWQDVTLPAMLRERYHLPVFIANDSHLAALASYSFDPHETNNLVLINIGRGIGAGIVLNGQLHYGEGFGAGEIGHVKVVTDGLLCSCGNYGCLEAMAGTRGILRQYEAVTGRPLTWDQFLQAKTEGDPAVAALIPEIGRHYATAIAHMIGILNVKSIVLAGEIKHLGQELITAIRTAVGQQVLPAMAAEADIRFTSLGENIVLLGAASLVLKGQLGL